MQAVPCARVRSPWRKSSASLKCIKESLHNMRSAAVKRITLLQRETMRTGPPINPRAAIRAAPSLRHAPVTTRSAATSITKLCYTLLVTRHPAQPAQCANSSTFYLTSAEQAAWQAAHRTSNLASSQSDLLRNCTIRESYQTWGRTKPPNT